MSGELVKLKIVAYTDEDFSSKADKEYDVLINPAKYTHNFNINYKDNESMGDTAGAPKFEKYSAESVSFSIVLDGSGIVPVSGTRKNVYEQLKALKDVVYTFNGAIHEPNYVQLLWGTMLFNGRTTSFKVEYNLFKPNGLPLRANVDLDFKGFTSKELSSKVANLSSPDLSHLIIVKAGDTLPNLCFKIYKDSTYCNEVAKLNNLNSFRNIKPGTQLLFPPLLKNGR
jgi:LysM repeat protein